MGRHERSGGRAIQEEGWIVEEVGQYSQPIGQAFSQRYAMLSLRVADDKP